MTAIETSTFHDAIAQISDLLDQGLHDQARALFEHAITDLATEQDLDRLVRLLDTFTRDPYITARAKLRSVWRDADPELRAWLNTFVTHTDPGLHRPEQDQPRWLTTVPLVAAEANVRRIQASNDTAAFTREPAPATEVAAKRARRKPEHVRALVTKRRGPRESWVVSEYMRTRFLLDTDPAEEPSAWDRAYVAQVADQVRAERDRAGARTHGNFNAFTVARARTGLTAVRDDDRPAFQANGNGLDYDQYAIAPEQGWVCVYCFAERACSDHYRTDPAGQRLSDDGLCQHCRETGRTGIAPLPHGFTLAEEVTAYCQYLTDQYPAVAAALLTSLRRRSTGTVRGLVTAFQDRARHATPSSAPVADLTAVRLRKARCCSCFADCLIDLDDLCEDCRELLPAA